MKSIAEAWLLGAMCMAICGKSVEESLGWPVVVYKKIMERK